MTGRTTLPRPSPQAARIVGLAISILALAAVVWWASRQSAPTLPSTRSEIAALIGALGVYGVAMAVRAERWLRLLRQDGAVAGRPDCYALTFVGYMGNNVLPARAGDAMRVYLMAPRAGSTMRGVLGTLIAERLLDALTLIALFAIVALGLLRGVDLPNGAAIPATLAALAVAVVAVLAGALLARRSPAGRRVLEMARPLVQATRDLRGRHGARMVAMTALIWALEALTYALTGLAVGFEIGVLESLYLVGLVGVFLLIPAGPGYIGTLDAAVIFGARAIGAAGDQSLSFLLMLRFVLMVPTTVVGLIVLVLRYGLGPITAERRAEAASP